MFELERSTVLSPEQWDAVQEHLQRIERARATRDWAQGVGSAKEMVESVARIALEVRGVGVSNSVKFPALIHEAHGVLERPDAEEFASDLPTRTIIKQAKGAVTQLAELRTAVGTGHGSATRRATLEEHVDVSMDAAVLWCRWAIRRLGAVVDGRHADLIGDLRGGRSFSAGDLSRRLRAVNLPTQDEGEQRLIGQAVGRRAASDTFTVRHDGVEVVAPGQAWPLQYRLGVVEGLFLGEDGFVRSNASAAACVPNLLADLESAGPDAEAAIKELMAQVIPSDLSYANSAEDRRRIAAALKEADRPGLPPLVTVLLRTLANKFEPSF
jgi:hypothetical protein